MPSPASRRWARSILANCWRLRPERAFWWPRFQRMARWFVATEARLGAHRNEVAGKRNRRRHAESAQTARPFASEARADRIDEVPSEGWQVIDYKTGRIPSPKELNALFAPQLLLEAAMAERGGFEKIGRKAEAVRLLYWQANGLGEGGDSRK